jgi:ribonuclease VapC
MFVDASALSAILLGEKEAESLTQRLERAETRCTSPLAVFEAAFAISRVHARGAGEAEMRVRAFLRRAEVSILSIRDETVSLALEAHARFGKGHGHPARLNLCDCFAYAMARQHGMPLLYKGDDFAQTDLA